jgi:phosphosulfolactate phosphohydrolase-like enzyme
MEGFHTRRLADNGFGEDVGYCSAIDTLNHVPILVTESETDRVAAPVVLARE